MPTEEVVLGEGGRIVLPVTVRKKLGLKKGDRLTITADNGPIKIYNMQMALNEIREAILAERGSLEGLLDEFLDEKHEEARREAQE
jgi:AbrB family looped-hinge helix DNA binding protein